MVLSIRVGMCISLMCCSFFFFKQKTAYEMRISDWSSDVCSSDLASCGAFLGTGWLAEAGCGGTKAWPVAAASPFAGCDCACGWAEQAGLTSRAARARRRIMAGLSKAWMKCANEPDSLRSEEHTSELQSLMRISYAVFCLKKKKNFRPALNPI